MGGVDLVDRMLSVCPSRNRTKKWTIRVISYLFDLGVVNAWLQHRIVEVEKGTPKKNIVQMREYKLNLGTKLIDDSEEESDDDGEVEYEELEPKHKKRKILIKPVPSKENRTKNTAHLSAYVTK
ncbi:hypothetical protein EVAR_98960_1 [Eumeta japonica]|uniref:PiggyBac transposable element-derived protein domain-containing protein n=1 Tax=Eumeta variegata TaxID=151549 RepID=A0A4C1YSV2_EUMVA|nr:hypothetical protein EVAR_98960_1 [Eumeta japonica]